jgi:hypothetical protein
LVISPFARPSITANDSSVDHWRFTVSYNPLHVIYTTVLPNVVLVVEVIDASDTVVAEEIALSTPITPQPSWDDHKIVFGSRQQSTDRSIANCQSA